MLYLNQIFRQDLTFWLNDRNFSNDFSRSDVSNSVHYRWRTVWKKKKKWKEKSERRDDAAAERRGERATREPLPFGLPQMNIRLLLYIGYVRVVYMYIRYPVISLIVRYLPQAIDKRHKIGRDSVANRSFQNLEMQRSTLANPMVRLMRMFDHV